MCLSRSIHLSVYTSGHCDGGGEEHGTAKLRWFREEEGKARQGAVQPAGRTPPPLGAQPASSSTSGAYISDERDARDVQK